MAFQIKKPPLKLSLTIKEFNLLLNILKVNELVDSGNESKKLIDKLLTYSIPKENENKEKIIEVRCFPSESTLFIKQLLMYNKDEGSDTNYFDILIENRKKYLSKNV